MTLTLTARAANAATLNTPLFIALLPGGSDLPSHLKALDKALGGALGRTLRRQDFRGGRDETLHLVGSGKGPRRVLLVGYGPAADRALALRRAATLGARQAHRLGVGSVAVSAGAVNAREAECVALGLQLGCWADTARAAEVLGMEVQSAVDGFTGPWGDVWIASALVDISIDDWRPDVGKYRRVIDVLVQWTGGSHGS